MPGTYTKTITIDNNTNQSGNPDYAWVYEWTVGASGWVTDQPGTLTNTTDFTVADNGTGAQRQCVVKAQHWNYSNDNTLEASFQITQSAAGVIETTTTTSTTTTTTSTTSTTSTTTEPPIQYTIALTNEGTSSDPLNFNAAAPNSVLVDYVTSPNGTPTTNQLPAWLTYSLITANSTTGQINIALNSDPATWPTLGEAATIDWVNAQADAQNPSTIDTVYAQFNPAPQNSILIGSSNVTNPVEYAGGLGGSTYEDDNSTNSATQAASYGVNMNPDATLTASQVYWSTTTPSSSSHAASTDPYWATALSINNTPSGGTYSATVSFTHIDPSGGSTLNPISSQEEVSGNEGASPMSSGPSSGIGDNQKYVIITHPDDATHWCAILVTAPTASVTTTTTQAEYTFNWTTLGNSNNHVLTEFGGINRFDFEWDGPQLAGGSASASDFNWPYWQGLGVADCTVYNTNGTTPHNGGDGYVEFNWPWNQVDPAPQQTNASGVTFNAASWLINSSSVTNSGHVTIAATCHVAGTSMNLADGTTKLVEDLQVGDILKSYTLAGLNENEETWETYSSQINQWSASETTAEVKSITSSLWSKYVNINNGLTKVTREHPVLILDSGNDIAFKAVRDVVVGDSLYVNGAWVAVTSLEEVNESITAYNIDVESADVYLADGILWHNVEEQIKE